MPNKSAQMKMNFDFEKLSWIVTFSKKAFFVNFCRNIQKLQNLILIKSAKIKFLKIKL